MGRGDERVGGSEKIKHGRNQERRTKGQRRSKKEKKDRRKRQKRKIEQTHLTWFRLPQSKCTNHIQALILLLLLYFL